MTPCDARVRHRALYELHDVAAYLDADARRLREFIGIADNAPRLKLESGA